jgi:hypothetical protein
MTFLNYKHTYKLNKHFFYVNNYKQNKCEMLSYLANLMLSEFALEEIMLNNVIGLFFSPFTI